MGQGLAACIRQGSFASGSRRIDAICKSRWIFKGTGKFPYTLAHSRIRARIREIPANRRSFTDAQGLDPSHYPHVYLVTTPFLFSYRFSPASFWYLYTSEKQLIHVIAEVNNTFSERRMYLFSNSTRQEQQQQHHGSSAGTIEFKQTHEKDFHVSPFSSRKGSYVLCTTDPAKDGRLSITITLRSSKGLAKLVARWWSDTLPYDPTQCSMLASLWLLTAWGWTILITCTFRCHLLLLTARKALRQPNRVKSQIQG